MRVVHICLRYPPATGGVETYVKELVEGARSIPSYDNELPESKVRDLRVLTTKMRTHGPISELDPEQLLDDPPYVQRLHHAATPLVAYPRLQALQYYLEHHKPDIVHGHSFWYHSADGAARYAQKHGIPFVLSPYYYENEVRSKLQWQLYRSTLGKRTFAAADAVVVISPYEKQLIEQAGFQVKRFEMIPPGIDFDEFDGQSANPFTSRSISGRVVLTVSRLAHGKGLSDAVSSMPEIVKQVPAAQLVIVGEDFGAKRELVNEADRLGITKRVHFLGKLPREELIGAYQNADLLLHPSHYEAFGIVLAESLASKTPVVARNTAAIPFVAPHEKAGLLFESKDDLTKQVARLLQDDTLRNLLANQGHQHIRENFTWDRSIKKMVDIYESLATSHSRPLRSS